MSLFVAKRYCALDFSALTSPDWFVAEQLSAYASPMSIVLKGALCLSKPQFRRNLYWLAALLSDVFLCNDRAIRSLTKEIYEKHCNPFIVLAAAALPLGIEDRDDVESSSP